MKVWNKEVNSCLDCMYCALVRETNENNTQFTLDMVLDCPYKQPITKEIIEKFGFKEFISASKEWIFQMKLNDIKSYIMIVEVFNKFYKIHICEKYVHDSLDESLDLYRGYCTNPEELKFVLSHLNII